MTPSKSRATARNFPTIEIILLPGRLWYYLDMPFAGKLLREGKGFLLAYDQGLEHGPSDFGDESVDPEQIVRIAREAGVFTGIIFQKGVAEKYYTGGGEVPGAGEALGGWPPLVVKLNGKTSFRSGEEPYSPPLCSVEEAVRLGAGAVGYTLYVGSRYEGQMMKELAPLEAEAHKRGLPVVGWMYPRGVQVAGKENTREIVAYAARVGLELGCDLVKVHYTGDVESFSWVVRSAGKAGVLAVGGPKQNEELFLKYASEVMAAGAVGMAVGRNIWQARDPVGLARKVAGVIWGGRR